MEPLPSWRTIIRVLVLPLALVATSVAAQLEQPLGSRIGRPAPARPPQVSRMSDGDVSRVTFLNFARCVALSSRGRTLQALALYINTEAAGSALSALATPDCLRNADLKFHPTIFRGALYVALYAADFGDRAPPSPAAEPIDYRADVAGAADLSARQYVALREFGDCTVRSAPAESRALVLAPIATSRENAAISAIVPHLGPCLIQGNNVAFNRLTLAGIIAEALYRLSTRPAPAATAGTK